MKSKLLLMLSFILGLTSTQGKKSYDGYKIISVTSETEEQINYITNLAIELPWIDLWKAPTKDDGEARLMVPPGKLAYVTILLRLNGMASTIVDNDIGKRIKAEERSIKEQGNNFKAQQRMRSLAYRESMDLHTFNTLEKIENWLDDVVKYCPPEVSCYVESIGKTVENRDIKALRIIPRRLAGNKDRRKIIVDATIHAREWLATSSILLIINQMIKSFSDDEQSLRQRYEWVFLPVLNPDGYLYSHNVDRFWRKNRQPYFIGFCTGVDLNRNFNVSFGTDGVSFIPCMGTYCGPMAASEPETRAIQQFLMKEGSKTDLYVTLHAYGNMLLFPYGPTAPDGSCKKTSDYNDLMDVAKEGVDAIEKYSGLKWKPGTPCEVIYPASGCSQDFAKAKAGIKYSYTGELRGTNFVAPTTEIPIAYNEIWAAIKAMIARIEEKKFNR